MSKINLTPNASGTGVFTIASPNSNTDYTMNLPEINGGTLVSTDASGNVGIGTSSPQSELDIQSTSPALHVEETAGNVFVEVGTTASNPYITYENSSSLRFATSTGANAAGFVERMRITSDGYLLLGTTSITVNTTNFGTRIGDATNVTLKSFRNAGGGSTCSAFGGNAGEARVMGDGDLQNTNNSYGALSDERLKSNIVDASSQIDDIMAVQVRSYTLDSTGATHIGVVAQELEASGMSGLVDEDEEGMKSVKYSILYMKAIKALQEAVAKIEDLESRLSALEAN